VIDPIRGARSRDRPADRDWTDRDRAATERSDVGAVATDIGSADSRARPDDPGVDDGGIVKGWW